jgi:hypothetical protein
MAAARARRDERPELRHRHATDDRQGGEPQASDDPVEIDAVPTDVAPYRRVRDLAVGSAVPLTEYLAALRAAPLDPSPLLLHPARGSPVR